MEGQELVRSGSGPLSVADIRQQINSIQELMRGAMQKDQHYGVIPGCGDKPTLLKPGAEKISMMFRLIPEYEVNRTDEPNGHREYHVTCTLKHGPTGTPAGQGVGSASTMEGKFRFRWEDTGNEVPKDYWKHRDREMIGGDSYAPRKTWVDKKQVWNIFQRIEHDNPADYYNTVLKMAKKRAHVDAVLTATAASDIFTQDIEDMPGAGAEHAAPSAKPPVAMPKEMQKPSSDPEGALTAEGTVEDVTVKTGKSAKGDWTKFGVKLDDGEFYGTFDAKAGAMAQELKGCRVSILYKQDGKYRNLLNIVPVKESNEAGGDPVYDEPGSGELL